ncbi:nucleotide pyrophosphohydrolase [Xanthomonas phage Xoo-sp13]|nr:nucleotide pyrophosphohydrolase [Xanthomonas phage Xoo-sp13]
MSDLSTPSSLLTERLSSFDSFVPYALRTESNPDASLVLHTNVRAFVAAVAASIASAEILDGFKKQLFYGKTANLLTKTSHYTAILEESISILNEGITEDSLGDPVALNPRVLHGLLGFVTEAGELASVLQKGVAGEAVDVVNIQEEVSDAAWYVAIIADELKLDFYQGLTNVVNKLYIRYPEKFTSFLADNRDLVAERAALEVGLEK